MVLQKADHIVKTMLCDTILALCRNTLPYEGEFCVEGLLGITMDNKEIFLVNINETIQKEGANKTPSKRKAAEEESRESDDVSSQDSDSDSQSPSKSKRKRKRKRRSREGSNQCFETSEMNEEKHSDPSGEEDSRLSANLIKNETENEDSRLSGDHMKHEQEQHHYIDDDNDEDIVFVKEEPKDYDTSCSYGPVSFPTPGGSTTGQSDSTGLGQLHELAMQLSGDISSSSLNTLGAMASQPSAAFQETSVSGNNQGFQNKVMHMLAEVKQAITKRPDQDDLDPLDTVTIEPATSMQELQDLNKCIASSAHFRNKLVRVSCRVGGNKVQDTVNAIIEKFVDLSLQEKLNMYGQRGKVPFASTPLYKQVVLVSAMMVHPAATEKQVKEAAAARLRIARKRLQKKVPVPTMQYKQEY